MDIPSYKIHNVLEMYTDKLRKEAQKKEQATLDLKKSNGKTEISDKRKRLKLINQVTNKIVAKMTQYDFKKTMGQVEDDSSSDETKPCGSNKFDRSRLKNKGMFRYNIFQNNEKIQRSLSLHNPDFIFNKER